jgi:hypothetical protein
VGVGDGGTGVAAGVDVAIGGGGVVVGVLVGGRVAVGVSVALAVGTGVVTEPVAMLLVAACSMDCGPDASVPHPAKSRTSALTRRSFLFIYRVPTKMSTKAVIPQRRSASCCSSATVTL